MPISVGAAPAMNGQCAAAGDLAEVAQQPDVDGRLIEMIVADQAAVRLAAELAELGFVELLEQRALVPLRVRIEAQVAVELVLGDVHDPDLQGRVGLGVVDEIVAGRARRSRSAGIPAHA